MVSPSQPDRSTLVPRIKSQQFLIALREMGIAEDELPLTEPLVGDLLISYAFDLPDLFRMATAPDIEKLAIPRADLRSLAIANLARQIPQIGLQDAPLLHRVVTGNNLEACTLLANPFWLDLAPQMPGKLVATVPSRDAVYFCGSDSHDGVQALRQTSLQVFSAAATHALSRNILQWTNAGWRVCGKY